MLRIGKVTKISLIVTTLLLVFLVSPVSAQNQSLSWIPDPAGNGCQLNDSGTLSVIPYDQKNRNPALGANSWLVCCKEKNDTYLWENKPNIPVGGNCTDVFNNKSNFNIISKGTIVAIGKVPQIITNSPEEICKKDDGDPKLTQVYKDCMNCINSDLGNGGKAENAGNIWTSSGCVRATEVGLANTLMRIIYGIALVFILLRIIIAGYLIQFGSNPDQIKENKQAIINAIIALIVGTGGIVIARFIGYDVLGIGNILPGLPKVI